MGLDHALASADTAAWINPRRLAVRIPTHLCRAAPQLQVPPVARPRNQLYRHNEVAAFWRPRCFSASAEGFGETRRSAPDHIVGARRRLGGGRCSGADTHVASSDATSCGRF